MARMEALVGPLLRLFGVLFCFCATWRASAQTQPATSPSLGDQLQVFLATMEPGDEPWERFGHDAIVIIDTGSGASRAYNFGVFDFDAPNFIGNFILGRMTYWIEADPGGPTLDMYANAHRSVWLQELNLSPEQRLKLFEKLEKNRQPENKYYRYDYYRDNCTTRVRDSIDEVTNHAIKNQLEKVSTDSTYRSYTRIGMAENFWLYTALELAMGPPTDRKLSAWQECFMPARLMEDLKIVTIDDGAGHSVPLVKRTVEYYKSNRTPLPSQPPQYWWIFLIAGLILGGVMILAAIKSARITFFTLASFWSLICSVAAVFMLCLWFFTDHEAGYYNTNLFQFNPISWLVLAAALRGFRWKSAKPLVLLAVFFSLLGILLCFIEWNWEMIALALSAHLGLAAGVILLQNKTVEARMTKPE
ncbi:MAG TPA: DUF4105 domain-containing protein [Tepidisphaeraceae bacterium]|nr:DUF4105 domain-containing protein [Tepidisphaeraceae bacterium]